MSRGASLRDRATAAESVVSALRDSVPSAELGKLRHFCWDRLDFNTTVDLSKSCLAEDWFVEAALEAGSPFVWRKTSPENSHRLLYRFARANNIERLTERGEYLREPHPLLLHQMTELIPALFLKAATGFEEQRTTKGQEQ